VAVASAVVMILKPHGGFGVTRVMKIHHMEWYSITGLIETHPESIVTATKGVPENVQGQGQGRLANDVNGGEAIAGTRTGG
jgi:hypothetical protein